MDRLEVVNANPTVLVGFVEIFGAHRLPEVMREKTVEQMRITLVGGE